MAITQTITALPAAPDPATMTRDEFSAAAAAFVLAQKAEVTELNTWAGQANAVATAMNLNSTTDTSATSNTIGVGSLTFTVTAGKSFQPGMWLIIADTAAPTTNSMYAQVASYSSTSLVVNSVATLGSGTKTAWTISQAAPVNTSFNRNRNLIMGGDFMTNPWQRGTSFTAPASTAFTADRFDLHHSTDAVVDILKTADAPTAAQASVYTTHCLHADVTTADAAIAAGQYYIIEQSIEGLNVAQAGFGQAGIRYVTLSFWHKHTKTGTYCVRFANSAGTRSYVAEYTQAVTDAYELAVITVAVDTTGTWLYDTGVGLRVDFVIASGSTYHTTAGTWQTGTFFSTANQVNGLDNVANNFKIALVQLELGSAATQFEALDESEVLRRCRRTTRIQTYYIPATTAQNLGTIDMRAVPIITGGGAGFTSTGTTADQLIAYQTAGAAAILTLVAEP